MYWNGEIARHRNRAIIFVIALALMIAIAPASFETAYAK